MKRAIHVLFAACMFFTSTGCFLDDSGDSKKSHSLAALTLITAYDAKPRDIVLNVSGLPYESGTYYIQIRSMIYSDNGKVSIDKTYNYQDIDNMNTLRAELTVSGRSNHLAVYLLANQYSTEPSFYASVNLDESTAEYNISYYIYYGQYFYNKTIRYGVSKQMMRQLSLSTLETQDFSEAPYYLYQVTGTKAKSLSVAATNIESTVQCSASHSLSGLLGSDYVVITPGHPWGFPAYGYEEQYILVTPTSYSHKTSSSLIINEVAPIPGPDPGRSFNFSHAELGSDGYIYFADSDNNNLVQWRMEDGIVSVIKNFEEPIRALVNTEDRSILYIAEGTRIWEYSCTSGSVTQKFNAPEDINGLYLAGSYIISCDSSGFWNTNRLLRTSDFLEIDSKDMLESSASFAYSPVNAKVYVLTDGMSPNDVCYQAIDLVNGKLGDYADSEYHGDYSLRHPVKIFPDESRIVVGTGVVFNTEDLTYNGSLGYDYADLAFDGDGTIFLLHNLSAMSGGIRCRLMKINPDLPYLLEGTPVEFTLTGKRIIRDADSFIVITQNSGGSNTITVSRYQISDL